MPLDSPRNRKIGDGADSAVAQGLLKQSAGKTFFPTCSRSWLVHLKGVLTMQGHLDSNKDKVVSIFSARQKAEALVNNQSASSEAPSFDDVMRKNAENLDRIRRERLQANKGVLKSYKIKD